MREDEEWTGYWDILCNRRQSPSLLMVFSQTIFYLYEHLDSGGSSFSILSMLFRESLKEAPCFTETIPLSSQSMDIFFINLHIERLWMLTTWNCWIISICQPKHQRLPLLLTMLTKLPSFPPHLSLRYKPEMNFCLSHVFAHDMVTYYEAVEKGFTLGYSVNVPQCFIA